MTLSRRTLLLAAGATGVLAMVPIARSGVVQHGLDLIRQHFGKSIAESDAAMEYMRAYVARTADRMHNRVGGALGEEPGVGAHLVAEAVEAYADYGLIGTGLAGSIDMALEESIIRSFLLSTNAYLAYRDGTELTFFAFAHPYEVPCGNQLTANFAGLPREQAPLS